MIRQLVVCWILFQKILKDDNNRKISKQQELDADSKEMQQIYLKSRSSRKYNNVFHYLRVERSHSRFFTNNRESIVNLLFFKVILIH